MLANKQNLDELKRLANLAGVDSETFNAANAATAKTATTMEKLDAVVGLAQKGFNELRPIISAFGSAMSSIVLGSNNLSDVYRAFSILPGPLGMVASGFAFLQKIQEENFAAFQKMSEAGVNFGGDINKLRIQASQMGLSLDQMAGFVTKNADALSRMGGGTDKAMKSFQLMSAQLIGSETGDHLRALGFTTEQVNQGMLNYIKFTGGRTSKEMENTGALIASSVSYMETLDGLARISGKTRDQQQAVLDEASKNAAFQAKLATMDEASRLKATEGMARALALGGKGAVDAFQSKIMGVAPDKAGAMFIATADRTAAVVNRIADSVFDKSKTIDDQKLMVVQGMRSAQQDMAKYGSQSLFAIIRAGGPVADALQQMGINANTANTMSDAEILKTMERVKTEGTAADKEVDNQKKMQEARDKLIASMELLRTSFEPDMINAVTSAIKAMTGFADWASKNTNMLENIVIAATAVWAGFKLLAGYRAIMGAGTIVAAGTAAAGGAAAGGAAAGGAAAGAGLGASITSIGTAIAAVGRMGIWVVAGAAAIGTAIALVGAGIAGAIWITGAALPKFSEGVMSFTKIDGDKLVTAAKGIAALAASMVVFGAGSPLAAVGTTMSSIIGGVSKFFGGSDVFGKIKETVTALDPIIPKLAILGPAMQAYGQGLVAYGMAVNSIDLSKADRLAELMKKPAVAAVVADLGKQALSVNASAASGTTDQKALQTVIVQLNNTMADIKRYMASTSDNTGRAVTEIRALNGNILPRP
jgi:hypothetical protein